MTDVAIMAKDAIVERCIWTWVIIARSVNAKKAKWGPREISYLYLSTYIITSFQLECVTYWYIVLKVELMSMMLRINLVSLVARGDLRPSEESTVSGTIPR
ncbi:hypothetical protein DFJ43DRAFT_1036128 [Lentinula guzmanii]|uniref:Uncharacterized protein n=1 Tax=Lentinula guzmanii TaxID=2804957 RepID=A0AA38JJ04_9AGAR|nr:hypothetical protein DFJ43DRAFT_1036128 [Lentinula guzmanii]